MRWPDRFVPRGLLALLVATCLPHAVDVSARGRPATTEPDAEGVSVQIRSDRLTLSIVQVPQVYLSGPVGPHMLQRVQELIQAGRIPEGADVYLDSSSGDMASGLALGRLFRASALNTHLGGWRKPAALGRLPAARPAVCLDACAYAYLGGVYRWAPSGADRIGTQASLLPAMQGDGQTRLTDGSATAPMTVRTSHETSTAPAPATSSPTPAVLRDYLLAMGIVQASFARVLEPPQNGVAWWNPEQMSAWLVANNGRMPMQIGYQHLPGAPTLTLSENVRGGQDRVVIQCTPHGAMLTAYYVRNFQLARQLATHATDSYFLLEWQPWPPHVGKSLQQQGDALVLQRELPFADLARVLHAKSLGARIEVANSVVSHGFYIEPALALGRSGGFYADCQIMQAAAPAANAQNGRGK